MKKYQMQLIAKNILVVQNELASSFITDASIVVQQVLKDWVFIVATLIVYPFMQLDFAKDMIIRIIKGKLWRVVYPLSRGLYKKGQ